jgi:hypothetical protein
MHMYADRVSEYFNLDKQQCSERLYKYEKLFDREDLEKCLELTDEVCQWFLSLELAEGLNEWFVYSAFKYHVGYIDSDKYNKIIARATDNLNL